MRNHRPPRHAFLCPDRFAFLILFTCVCAVSGPAPHAVAEVSSIWTFDFRDVFYDIAYLNRQDAVIVGARGRVLVTHRKYKRLWSLRDSDTKKLLTCVSFSDNKHGWAAGHSGVIVHTDDGGRTWTIQRKPSPKNRPLFDIQFVSPKVGYACGAFDTFVKTTDGGTTWTNSPTGLDNMYNGLAFLDEDNGFLAGEFGTVLRTTDGGTSWTPLNLGGYQGSLFGISIVSPRKILVYGIAGKLMRSDDGGQTWEELRSGVDQSLFRAAVSRNEVLIVGASGTILYSSDGGRHFEQRNDPESTTFAGVCARPEGGFLCVGERGKILRFDTSRKD